MLTDILFCLEEAKLLTVLSRLTAVRMTVILGFVYSYSLECSDRAKKQKNVLTAGLFLYLQEKLPLRQI